MRNGNSVAAYVAIGSNLGDRARYCYSAVQQLSIHPQISITRLSSLFETAPVGGPEGSPPFLNGAIALETSLGAHALLDELHAIENRLGRDRRQRWEPRVIDLDLLLYGDKILSRDHCIVPHPMMHQRAFVLEPLMQIAPDALHPTMQMTVRGLHDQLQTTI
ncbi:MAG: 2-amino-4-hydroxy-6-hydroxymethyldihydropteridine diphosphokinase [Tepidisphaeraceae bacterium]